MKMHSQGLIIVITTWSVVTMSTALICPPGTCEVAKCKMDKEECLKDNGKIISTGGICGCCPSCLIQLRENEACLQIMNDLPPTSVCEQGLSCYRGRCVSLEKCGEHQNIKGYNVTCEKNSTFSKVQCSSKMCWCSGPQGQFLGRKTPVEDGDKLGCGCMVKQLLNKKIFGVYGVNCDDYGNYKTLQCSDNKCHCVDNITGQRKSNIVHIDDRQLLHCD